MFVIVDSTSSAKFGDIVISTHPDREEAVAQCMQIRSTYPALSPQILMMQSPGPLAVGERLPARTKRRRVPIPVF